MSGKFLPLPGNNIRSVALIGAQWFAGMASLPPRNGNPDANSRQSLAVPVYDHPGAGAKKRACEDRLGGDGDV